MNARQICHRLKETFHELKLPISKPQAGNLALWCHALAVSANCHLPTLALGLPLPIERASGTRRLERFLDLPRDPLGCYLPVAAHLLAHWQGRELVLVLDRTVIEARYAILLLAAPYRGRALPLAWQVLDYGTSDAREQIALLARLRPWLPAGVERVQVLGDGEFRSVELQRWLGEQGWHWQLGLKSDWLFHPGDGDFAPLHSLQVPAGERRYLQQVTLTREHAFGPVALLALGPHGQDPARYFALDQPADKQAWRRGRKRFWIEPTFRDWKSYGFDLEHSRVEAPARLNTMLLGISLTTCWMIHIGDELERTGRRHWLQPDHKDDYSLFRLGRDWMQRIRHQDRGRVPIGFTVSHAA